jgi:hypothetical protein
LICQKASGEEEREDGCDCWVIERPFRHTCVVVPWAALWVCTSFYSYCNTYATAATIARWEDRCRGRGGAEAVVQTSRRTRRSPLQTNSKTLRQVEPLARGLCERGERGSRVSDCACQLSIQRSQWCVCARARIRPSADRCPWGHCCHRQALSNRNQLCYLVCSHQCPQMGALYKRRLI